MQADFTDRPEDLPELIKRFEGGADVIVGERQMEGPMAEFTCNYSDAEPKHVAHFTRITHRKNPIF